MFTIMRDQDVQMRISLSTHIAFDLANFGKIVFFPYYMWHIFSKAFNALQIAVNFYVSARQRGLTSHAISWTVSLSKQPRWITVSHLVIVKRNLQTNPTIYQLSSNSASLSAIIALSESLLVVEVSSQGGGLADTDETVSAKHVSPLLLTEMNFHPHLGHCLLLPFALASLAHPPSRKIRKARAA